MKKNVLFFLIILFGISSIYSIPKPKKNQKVGVIVGKFKDNLGWKISVNLLDVDRSTRKYFRQHKNYFFQVNLEPGRYMIQSINVQHAKGGVHYSGTFLVLNYNISFVVESNKITPVNFFEIITSEIKDDSFRYQLKVDRENSSDYLNDLKVFFDNIDKRGFWKDFEWLE